MKTIVQDYGPIYGEVVNGTVQGRPNGSVYVPISNVITLSEQRLNTVVYLNGTRLQTYGQIIFVAESQDLASYVKFSLYTDAACTTLFDAAATRSLPAGGFNSMVNYIGNAGSAPTTGTKYYLRAELINNGSAVATSNVLELTGQ